MTGSELKSLRLSYGLSQRQAARQCEVAERSFARWESGERPVPAGAVKLLRLLNQKGRK